MAAAGGARLLRASSAALGGAARRWLLGGAARVGAGGRPGSRPLGLSAAARCSSEDKITVHFLNRDGEILTTKGKIGDSLLDVVIENNLDIDGFGLHRPVVCVHRLCIYGTSSLLITFHRPTLPRHPSKIPHSVLCFHASGSTPFIGLFC
ncbi:adrenodoxin, mitochondrial isoform X3 [Pipistrellus kuhlii]|uniref:adrenodoxin, mitochondrial isoform X3 n=1 Tax=Pipistrellus kuhlii TaxID=59472 RepID=UPI00174F52A9|nr:adrenodoxin, mitochondrial isoform X3 [Pipistrellus kuhlii]